MMQTSLCSAIQSIHGEVAQLKQLIIGTHFPNACNRGNSSSPSDDHELSPKFKLTNCTLNDLLGPLGLSSMGSLPTRHSFQTTQPINNTPCQELPTAFNSGMTTMASGLTRPLPTTGLVIPDLPIQYTDGTRSAKEYSWCIIVSHWVHGDPERGLNIPLKDWPKEWYTDKNRLFASKRGQREDIALEFQDMWVPLCQSCIHLILIYSQTPQQRSLVQTSIPRIQTRPHCFAPCCPQGTGKARGP